MAVGRRRVTVVALTAGLLAAGTATVTATVSASASSDPAAASAGTAPVRDIPGCAEEQRATWTNGLPAPWEACNSRSGIQGIEGSNAVNSRGTIFQAAAVLDKDGHAGLARSRDGGKTWQRVTLPIEFWDIIGYVQVDPATNRVFYTSIARPSQTGPGSGTTNPIGYSDDDGNTWHVTRIGGAANGEPDTLGDLGSIFIGPPPKGTKTSGYPNVVYTCNLTPQPSSPTSDAQCWRSLDGGKSFQRPSAPTFSRATADCPPNGVLIPNRGVVARDGTVYLPMSECGQWVVGVSKDAGKTFTWNPIPGARNEIDQAALADQQANVPGCAGSVAFAGCPEVFQLYGQQRLALDAKGTLYFIHNKDGLRLSVSADGGKSWAESTIVSVPGVFTVWSSIVARGNGQVGLSYLGQSQGSRDWHGYMAVVERADNPRARTIATARVSAPDNPLMPYRCCGSRQMILPPGTPPQAFPYNLIEHGGLSYAPDGTLWAAFFRDSTRDPANTQSAAYEIVAGHMAPSGAR
ncbi:hypothetical protein BL253_34485 [Pseudofrankia asymbiotica]|uniref:Sialidase domain-containing protein n=1 Tax=Pseudofrankia asymbiotica TaxID=1834516 RepID=A0A1V2I0D6_9ACTN|nr:hypothetical protein BL253_34485 [Pseudofrankia asymbiotica]